MITVRVKLSMLLFTPADGYHFSLPITDSRFLALRFLWPGTLLGPSSGRFWWCTAHIQWVACVELLPRELR